MKQRKLQDHDRKRKRIQDIDTWLEEIERAIKNY